MSQSKKKNILVGDIGNTETKIFFRNNKIEKKIALKSNEMIYSKIKSKVLFLKKFNIKDKAVFCSVCLLYTSPSPRDNTTSRMPSSA